MCGRGQNKAECHRVGNVPSCIWVLTLQIATSNILIHELLVWSQLCQEVVCECVPKLWFITKCQILYLCDPLCLCERQFAKSDCQARIMVITIMVIYYFFCAWQYSRCISSFNLSNISWVDIYNIDYNDLRRLNEYTQLQACLFLIVLFYSILDPVLELHCETHHNIYNIPIKCKAVR